MWGGAWGLNTPLNVGLKEGKAKGRWDSAGRMRCGVEQGKETGGGRRPDTRGRAVSERKERGREREEKRAAGGVGLEEDTGWRD
jgi:hypothetical protein